MAIAPVTTATILERSILNQFTQLAGQFVRSFRLLDRFKDEASGTVLLQLSDELSPRCFVPTLYQLYRMTMDCMHINGIRAYGYTGFLPEEQVLGQWFQVDLTLWLDLSIAGKSDRLEETYDYSKIVMAVKHLIQTIKPKLLERLAEEIAVLVLTSDQITQVKVRLTKLQPPIPNFDGHIVLEITRDRQN